MRRFVVPLAILAVALAASVLSARANDDANPEVDQSAVDVPQAGTPVLNARRIPEWLRQPESDDALEDAVMAITTVLPFGLPQTMCLSVRRDGIPVASHNADVPHTPAGLQRIVTAGVAIDTLRADSTYTTEVVMDGDPEIVDGVLQGNIWLIGRGDPAISTSTYIDRFGDDRARTDIADLARDTAADLNRRGITSIAGSVLGDDSHYVAEPDYTGQVLADGSVVWDANDNTANQVGPLSALLVDDGFASWPIEVDQSANVPAPDPAQRAAAVFTQLLVFSEGLPVAGLAGNQDAPDSRTSLATIPSPERDAIVRRALIDGTTAEMLFKEISRRSGSDGERANGTIASFFTLQALGLDVGLAVDGSGLSDANLTTCETIISLIEHPEIGPPLQAALPDASDTALAGCAPATGMKLLTATEENTSAMVGVYAADNGDVITFTMIANNPDFAAQLDTPCNAFSGTLLDAVVGHPYGTDLTEILPLPATS